MPFHPHRVLFFFLLFTLSTLSCGEQDHDDNDLRVVQQADILRAKLGQSVKGSFMLVNPSHNTMQFTINSQTPKNLLSTAITHGTIAPKSAQEIPITATCPMHDGQFVMKLTITNDIPGSHPADVFLRLQCGWVGADPETIGTLLVIINDLPEHLNANITVEGPENFMASIDTTTTLPGLPLGRYVLTAHPVDDGDKHYQPAPVSFILTVANIHEARAQFSYSLQPKPDDD